MTGKTSDIDISLPNIWKSWFAFRSGKRASTAISDFEYHLEANLWKLYQDLNEGNYKHGGYSHFIVYDNKPREISVATVRDRVVHRLLYDYLVPIWDKTFIYDAWSCRKGKGVLGAIERAQTFMWRHPDAWLCLAKDKNTLEQIRIKTTAFLSNGLSLTVNPKINQIKLVREGISYLGVDIWSHGRRLQLRMNNRIKQKLSTENVSSYKALVSAHQKRKKLKDVTWRLLSREPFI